MGYANIRPRPTNGNYQSRVLKPAKKKKKSYWFVWVCAILLFVPGITLFCLLRGAGSVEDAESIQDAKPTKGAESANGAKSTSGTVPKQNTRQEERRHISYESLKIGEYINLKDKEFCERLYLNLGRVKTDEVKEEYDERRGANVYYYEDKIENYIYYGCVKPAEKWKESNIHSKTVYEISNKLVKKWEVETWKPIPNIVINPSIGSALRAAERFALNLVGDKVLATSKNIKYRGSNWGRLKESVYSAVSDVSKNNGWVEIQVKRSGKYSDYYAKWFFAKAGDFYSVQTMESDQYEEMEKDVELWDVNIPEVSLYE